MNTTFLILMIVLLFSTGACCCDQTEPECVASKIYESNVHFKTSGLEKFYCAEDHHALELKKVMADKIKEKDKGKKFKFSDIVFDFEGVNYDLSIKADNTAAVKITGELTGAIEGSDFRKVQKVNQEIILHKRAGAWLYCPSAQ